MKRMTLCLGLVGLLAMAWSISAQEEATTVQSGVFSEEQAGRGEQLFGEACLVCHQPEEFATGGYMDGWSGMSVNDFVEFVRSTMPEDNPGRLKREEYIDIIAFVFQQNGLPAGETEMERAGLKDIQIEGPFGESAQ